MNNSGPIRVILVDDHPIVRSGIRGLLEKASDIEVVGEAENGESALRLADDAAADVLLLDMELPDLPGPQVAARLKQNHPELKILTLSAHDDSVYVRQLLEQGAAGYLMKEEAPEVILDAVRGVARGQQGWISREIAAQISNWIQVEMEEDTRLTRREIETLGLLVEGKTNQAIAADLNISEKTVEKHIKAIFDKLKVSSRVEAAVSAVKRGIVKN
jgi:two-component system NarL family response regulator